MYELISNIWSKDYRDYYTENPPNWNYPQILFLVLMYVRSDRKAAELLKEYASMLQDSNEIRICKLLAKDLKRIGDVSPETETLYRSRYKHTILNGTDLKIPKLFKQYDVIRYLDYLSYGNKPQQGLLVSADSGDRYCQIYNLEKMNTPREALYWESKADIVDLFNVEKMDIRFLKHKAMRNYRMVMDRIERVGGWPVFSRLCRMKEQGVSIEWW